MPTPATIILTIAFIGLLIIVLTEFGVFDKKIKQ